MTRLDRTALVSIALACSVCAQDDSYVQTVVDQISEQHLRAKLERLVSFGERNALTASTDTERGITAARDWILSELKSYNPRLDAQISAWPTGVRGNPLYNVIATLPGTTMSEKQVLVTAHYDSRGGPGASDNATGTVAMMEVARVLSQYRFPKTLVFIAFAAEEYGLLGSRLEAAKAKRKNAQIEAVLNADIVGNDTATKDGRMIHVYAGVSAISISVGLANYSKAVAEQLTPMQIEIRPGQDRPGRGSDHMPYQDLGFAAIRFVTPYEYVPNQHSPRDTIEGVSFRYNTLAAKVIASVAASLAMDLPAE